MAKLARVTQKIFAINAPSNQVTEFGTIKAGSPVYTKSPADIMNSDFEDGWSDAVEDDYAPYRQDRNAIDLAVSTQLAYIFQEGCPEYDSGTTYYATSVVKYLDGTNLKFYWSVADNNTSALSDTTKWKLFMTISNTGEITLTGIVPDRTAGDSSSYAANTRFVTTAITNLSNSAILKTGNQTKSGILTFNDSPTVPTLTTSDNSTKAINSAWFNNKFVEFSGSLPSPVDNNVFYYELEE